MEKSFLEKVTRVSVTALVTMVFSFTHVTLAQTTTVGYIATTTVTTSICGNSLVEPGEDCDVPGESGSYSTTIVGRQCDEECDYGPYCGDEILQTMYGEQCDDGNNVSGDFCSATCTIEPAGSGGGGTSGGGSRDRGGSNEELGDTQVSVTGQTFPRANVNIILDTRNVGNVRAGSTGRFEFATNASPGTVSMGFWTTDSKGVRSITNNTTFDVTQGAITNVNGIIIPPTISLSKTAINPGESITISGQAVPNALIEIQIGSAQRKQTANSDADGNWSLTYSTAGLPAAEYGVKARSVETVNGVSTESGYSTVIQLAVGVDGKSSTPSDLNRDGSVNLTDFSIMIFWWGTNGGDSDPPADINSNGRVSIEDFSILLFNWTG